MPTNMFINLKQEKKQKFLEAATIELTTKSYKDVTIMSISKRAGISRGTFYNYFDSVGELFEFLIEGVKQTRHQYSQKILEESNYNLFLFLKNIFVYDFDQFKEHSNHSLLRNYIHYLRDSNKSFKDYFLLKVLEPILVNTDFKLYDKALYNVSEDEFFQAIELLGSFMSELLYKSETNNISKEETFKEFNFVINLIESGLKSLNH